MEILSSLYLLVDVTVEQAGSPVAAISLSLVVVAGFVAAISLGSLAWYNSKRPPGWEGKKRPSIVPEIPVEENPGLGTPDL